MIPKTKFGDCGNPDCNERDTSCVKVGRVLYCLKCRKKQKISKQIEKSIPKSLHKVQKETNGQLGEEKASIIQDLDSAFSQYVRKKEALPSGLVQCFTCDCKLDWKKMDCGHFVSRKNMLLRWDARNARPQCKECNQYNQGELANFALNLELEQRGSVMALLEESKVVCKWTRGDLKEKLIDIREKLKIVNMKFKI
jgi:hypothetical protein